MITKNKFFIFLLSVLPLHSSIEITVPGIYQITDDTTYTPTIPNDAIFKILANNVTIDFAHHVLTQNSGAMFPGLDAILVGTGYSSVAIKNVNVQNISGSGIHLYDGCSNITIIGNTLQSCHKSGIFFEGTASGTGIKNCIINDCTVSTCTGLDKLPAYGIRFEQCSNTQISNCLATYIDANSTTSGYGIYLNSCKDCIIQKSSATFNGGTGLVAGVALVSSATCFLEEVNTFNNLNRDFGNSGNACGFLLDKSYSIVLLSCNSNCNRNAKTSSFGFLSQDGQNNAFQNCIAERNIGGTVAAGIQLSNEKKTSILDCKLQNHVTTISGTAYGIFLTNNCDNCFVKGNVVTNNLGATSSFGVRDSRSSSTSTVISNFGFNNGTNFSVTYPLTITLPILTGSLSNILIGLPSLASAAIDNISVNP